MRYDIQGNDMPVVICHLDSNESMISEAGSMVWMSPNMQMETNAGGLGRALGRMFAGESAFRNVYTARNGEGMIAFASRFPGSIVVREVTPERPIIAQKSAFLAATAGVELSVYLQKKAGAGFFSGEGFVMQKISGRGLVFLELDGSAISYDLGVGEQLVVDTGHVALVDGSCRIDIQTVRGAKNVLFGGEGLFNTVLTGPGRVTLQTMPVSKLVELIASRMPAGGNG